MIILSLDNDTQLRQEFKDYLSQEVESFATIELSAKENIIKTILSPQGTLLENYIAYFKCLVNYMKNNRRVKPDDRNGTHPSGYYVYYPIGSKESGTNNFSSLLLCLYFISHGNSFTIYDLGFSRSL